MDVGVNEPHDTTDAKGQPGDKVAVWAWKQIEDAAERVNRWRKAAREADRFVAGQHFTKADLEKLDREGRPRAAFNVAQKFLRFISGLERRAKVEVRFMPRHVEVPEQAQLADLVSKVYHWVIEQCDGDSERSQAFEDMLVRGMGWTDVYFDRSVDPEGQILLARVDGNEMFWDTESKRQNLTDARWVAHYKQIDKDLAKRRWPEHEFLIDANAGRTAASRTTTEDSAFLYSEVQAVPRDMATWPTIRKNNVPLLEFQWFDEEPGVYFVDPYKQQDTWMDEKTFRVFLRRYTRLNPGAKIDFDRQLVRKYRRALILGRTVISGPFDLPGQRFTYNCMTGSWEPEEGIWYGFNQMLMDPQKYLTKFVNQVMEIITRSAKGGLMAETDAFHNLAQAENSWAQTGSITWMSPGALANGKVKEKSLPSLPEASIAMFNVCTQMLREVTGISPEVSMGLGEADQPALTMRQRQLASIALLAKEFDALSRYRTAEAKTIFEFLQYIADDRIVRIGGPYDSQAVQLMRDPFMLKYDVTLEESDRDPNMREQYMQMITELAPGLMRKDMFLPEMLDYFPLPGAIREKIKQAMREQKQMAQQQGAMARGKQDDPREIQARIQKLGAETVYTQAKTAVLTQQAGLQQAKLQSEATGAQAMTREQDRKDQELVVKAGTEIARDSRERARDQATIMKNVIEGLQSQQAVPGQPAE